MFKHILQTVARFVLVVALLGGLLPSSVVKDCKICRFSAVLTT